MFTKLRDKAFAVLAGSFFNRWLKSQTQAVKNVKNLEVDSSQKTFSMDLELVGETQPLNVTGQYRLVSQDGKTAFAPVNIRTSREWATILAGEWLHGRTIEVPGAVARLL